MSSFGLLDSAWSAVQRSRREVHKPTGSRLGLPIAGSAGPEDRRTMNVELIILITVLLLLFGGGGFYIYKGGWWGSPRGNRSAGPVGNPLAIISVAVLIIVFVVWRLILILR